MCKKHHYPKNIHFSLCYAVGFVFKINTYFTKKPKDFYIKCVCKDFPKLGTKYT